MASSDAERPTVIRGERVDRGKKSSGQWLKPGGSKKKGKEDIRRYIPVHGKILKPSSSPLSSSHIPPSVHRTQGTVRALWTQRGGDSSSLADEKRGRGKEKVPASCYTKGVRRKVELSSVEAFADEGKENSSRVDQSIFEKAKRNISVPKLGVAVRKKVCSSRRDGKLDTPVRSCAASPPCTHPSTSRPSDGWLSTRSPKRSSAKRRPLDTINAQPFMDSPLYHKAKDTVSFDREEIQFVGRPASKRLKVSAPQKHQLLPVDAPVGKRLSVCDSKISDFNNPSLSSLIQPSTGEKTCLSGADPLDRPNPSPPPPDGISEGSDLSWMDAELPSQYKLSPLPSSSILPDTNDLLEELSACERMLSTGETALQTLAKSTLSLL